MTPAGDQLGLFGAPEDGRVRPAAVSEAVRGLGRQAPPGLFCGTCSWSFPGWADIVYDREHPNRRLARDGIAAYARHPLLSAVSVDHSFYGPPKESDWRRLAARLPSRFRCLVKAHELCTTAQLPDLARFGTRRGRRNPLVLDPDYASEVVVAPTVAGLGPERTVLLLQFPPQDPGAFGGPEAFAERLESFLAGLAPKIPVAIELRSPALLTSAYVGVLKRSGATHAWSVHPAMPTPLQQARRLGVSASALATAGPDPQQEEGARRRGRAPMVLRWMLRRDLRYDEARSRFAPFDRRCAPDQAMADELRRLALAGLRSGREVVLTVNNKAEGSAPLSIEAWVKELVQGLPRDRG